MNKIIIANWKMNKTFTESMEFLTQACKLIKDRMAKDKEYAKNVKNNVIGIAMPFTNLSTFLPFEGDKDFPIMPVAQDISLYDQGAYTGEISAKMLVDLGIKYVIVGHSERRRYQGETDKIVNLKAKKAIEYGLIPIVCVGEELEDYEKHLSKEVVKQRTINSLFGLDLDKLILSYEPVWAMGTGHCASREWVEEMTAFIKEITSPNLHIMYGGSVSLKTNEELSQIVPNDGFLIGNCTLDLNNFVEIIGTKFKHKED